MEIQLESLWKIGIRIDGGGFANVYEATNADGAFAVAKLIPKEPGADRELLFESLSGKPNIVPILDSGEFEGFYVIVMPRAEKSLRSHLETTGALAVDDASAILLDIATALASLETDVVHRDLKPENVLFLESRWCIADFGIARYAEASTAPDTRRFSMTPPYAAPEQWRGERATHATDVYAFGVMAFELVSGQRPFQSEDLRHEHLHVAAPAIRNCPSPFASLVAECLLKPRASRPSAKSIANRLSKGMSASTPAVGQLQEANERVVQNKAREDATASEQQTKEEARAELFAAAGQTLARIVGDLRARIVTAAPATQEKRGELLALELGDASLTVASVQSQPEGVLLTNHFRGGFDVIASSSIRVQKPRDRYDHDGGEHSLWYCDAEQEGSYRWYELGFSFSGFVARRSVTNPFSLPPGERDAQLALSMTMHTIDLFWPPLAFDQGDEEQFIERWAEWFAAASTGNLELWQHHPSRRTGQRNYRVLRF